MDRKTHRLAILISMFVLIGVYLFFLSEGGMIERSRLKQADRALSRTTVKIKADREILESILRDYDSGKVSGEDLINSGFLRDTDRVVLFKDALGSRRTADDELSVPDNGAAMRIYRIGWGIVTFSIIIILFLVRPKSAAENHG